MPHEIHYPILSQLGISESEALIYELLLELGPQPANKLLSPSGMSRGNLYNVLISLGKKGLVLKKKGKKTVYEAAPPSKLTTLLQKEQHRIQQLTSSLNSIIPLLNSEFNLSTGKPVIQLFEGPAGAEKAIYDTLHSKTEILTYLDTEALSLDKFAEVNRRYLKQRIKNEIKKRIIVEDSPQTRAFFQKQNTPFTTVVFMPNFPSRFHTAMEIYDGKVSYMTLSPEKQISMIVQDKNIYEMHRAQFEFLWGTYFAAATNSSPSTSLEPASASSGSSTT